jgi:thymidine kinase
MFLENTTRTRQQKGSLEVICGSMFSGKTEELIRRLKRAEFAKLKVEIFKPAVDKRYHVEEVVSHDSNSIRSTPVNTAEEILLLSEGVDVIGIDEAQFFDAKLPDVCSELANRGIRILVAGLDMDYLGQPFGPMPALLSIAEYVTKVHAICMHCGDLANHSHRISKNNELVLVGEKDHYTPLCRTCFNKARKGS